MKYLKQFGVILGFSFLGEVLHYLIPLPIPAAIYGMVLLFLALTLKIVPAEWVQNTGNWLVSILPILFVAPAVGLLGCWDVLVPNLLPIVVIIVVSTVVTFAAAGIVTQLLVKVKKEDKDHD